MIDLQQLYEWRWVDPENGLILPYYTRPCLDWLMKQPLQGKRVFEYGIGASSVWYHAKGVNLYGVESDESWYNTVTRQLNTAKISLCKPEEYPDSIRKWDDFDIIIVDGIERDRCVLEAIKKTRAGTRIIIDNWVQPSAYTPSKPVQQLVESMNHIIYPQPGHPDWQTLVLWT